MPATLGRGGRAAGTYWVTEVAARWALRRQGHPEVAARRWVDEGLHPPGLPVPMAALAVRVSVDTVQRASSPAGDWWDRGLVVLCGQAVRTCS